VVAIFLRPRLDLLLMVSTLTSDIIVARDVSICGDTSLPLVIVNPKSASGATSEKWTATASDLRSHFGPFGVAFTEGPRDAIAIAEREARNGRKFIIACGGDGTINEVANGIILSGTDAELGVLPSGTGGDFRRTLGIPLTNREISTTLRDGKTRMIDAGRVTFQSHDGKTISRYFVNVASVGLAAAVIERVKSAKFFNWLPIDALRGRANFAISALQEVFDLNPVNIRIRIDGEEEKTVQTINFCVANSRYFGGGMKIAPDAKLSDGLLDVVNIGHMSSGRILFNAVSLYRGRHFDVKEVKTTVASRIEVSAVDPAHEILLDTDGEMPGRLPAIFEIVPNAIRVRVPKSLP